MRLDADEILAKERRTSPGTAGTERGKVSQRRKVYPVQTEHVRLSSAIRVVSKTDTFQHPASSSLPGIGNTVRGAF